LIYAVKNNPLESLGMFIAASALGLASSLVIKIRLYKRKFRLLAEEEKLLLELMKVVQRECFQNKHMSMEEYEESISSYEAKLSQTIEDKIRVETKLVNLMKLRGKDKALTDEKNRLIDLMKNLQNDYLNKGKIETRVYENMLKSYSARLNDVEEQITFIEAQNALKSTKFGFFRSRKVKLKKKDKSKNGKNEVKK